MKVSLFCSSIRPENWEPLMESLKSNSLEYEVVVCGFIDDDFVKEHIGFNIKERYAQFRYIQTKRGIDGYPANIKPAQCYEIARRACTGDLVGWISDDCVFPPNALDKIYEHWCSLKDKTVIAVKNTDPATENNNLNDQRFYAKNHNTPQMARIGFMSREYLQVLGGIDRRYLYGKWDDDICMRVWADGGKVVRYEGVDIQLELSNKNWHITNDWTGVNDDGEILENSWTLHGFKGLPPRLLIFDKSKIVMYYPITNQEVTLERKDSFEGFSNIDLYSKSQGLIGIWS